MGGIPNTDLPRGACWTSANKNIVLCTDIWRRRSGRSMHKTDSTSWRSRRRGFHFSGQAGPTMQLLCRQIISLPKNRYIFQLLSFILHVCCMIFRVELYSPLEIGCVCSREARLIAHFKSQGWTTPQIDFLLAVIMRRLRF